VGFREALGAPVDPASLVVFRVGFGVLAAGAAARFVALGWVEALYLAPGFHFAWADWARAPAAPLMYGLFAAQLVAGVGIALGWRVKICLTAWLLTFGYVELLDKALYLNHYVLFTLLGLTLLLSPTARWDRPGRTWALWLLRLQVGLVYLWAGLCKLNADWLLRAEPLSTWLGARAELPLVGPLLAEPAAAFGMSWGGAAYDLSAPFLLLHPRTRPLGMLLVVGFHVTVGLLFPLGVFPWVMVLGATLLLDPGWPRGWLARLRSSPVGDDRARVGHERAPLSRAATAVWVALALSLALFPALPAVGDGRELDRAGLSLRVAGAAQREDRAGGLPGGGSRERPDLAGDAWGGADDGSARPAPHPAGSDPGLRAAPRALTGGAGGRGGVRRRLGEPERSPRPAADRSGGRPHPPARRFRANGLDCAIRHTVACGRAHRLPPPSALRGEGNDLDGSRDDGRLR